MSLIAPAPAKPHLSLLLNQHRQKIEHGFFSREGGQSLGLYQGLNCGLGSSDDRSRVLANRASVSAWFGQNPDRLVTLCQVHSPDVMVVTQPWTSDTPKADAMVTNQPGVILGILTADCVPVLFADHQAGIIGAAHAGWKGALNGVIENTVDAMVWLGAQADKIEVCIGPCIRQMSYEVGPNFPEVFLAQSDENQAFFQAAEKPGHLLFDLAGYVAHRLKRKHIDVIEDLQMDTYPEANGFYSFRRTTHRQEPDYGRQISAIALKA